VKEGPAIFYHDGCMIQAPHGCFYYWTYGFPGNWLSRGSLNTLLHSRLNKTIHFLDCCCMVHWIFMILSRISILNSCYLSSFQSCRSFQCIMSVVPIMSHYFSLFQPRWAVYHILLLWLASLFPFPLWTPANFISKTTLLKLLPLLATIHLAPSQGRLLATPPVQPTQQCRSAVQTVAGVPCPGIVTWCAPPSSSSSVCSCRVGPTSPFNLTNY
jgi:hypothetical protein